MEREKKKYEKKNRRHEEWYFCASVELAECVVGGCVRACVCVRSIVLFGRILNGMARNGRRQNEISDNNNHKMKKEKNENERKQQKNEKKEKREKVACQWQ